MKQSTRALALAAGVFMIRTGTTFGGSVITGITTDLPGGTINNTANLTSITSNGGQTVSRLAGPADVAYSGTSAVTYRGRAGAGTPAAASSLLALDVSTGVTSNAGQQTINVIFPTPAAYRIFLLDVSEGTSVEGAYTLQAITSGTASSPVLGGVPFTLPTTWGDTGRDLDGYFPATNFPFVQNIVGYAVDTSELGVASLIGVRVVAPTGADPAAIVAGVPTGLESWRKTHFGTMANTGSAADLADPDSDGQVNLIEFATGGFPLVSTASPGTLVKSGATLEYTYTRPVAAVAELNYQLEASAMLSGSWTITGSTEEILGNNGVTQTVKASTPAAAGKRFVRLRVTRR